METLEAAQIHSDPVLTFRAKAIAVEPMDRLGDVNFGSNSVEGEIEYPEADATYILRTYLATESGGTDYLVDESRVTSADPSFQVQIPAIGAAAPTGSYYATTYLLKEVTYMPEGSEEPETAYIAIGSSSSSSKDFSYTNTSAPDAPQTVTLTAAGNETMVASWAAVDDADGYRITIYEKNGTDTGFGYEYSVEQFQEDLNGAANPDYMPGLSYDEDTGTYSIDMAMTVGDPDLRDAEGNRLQLEAGESYLVGVTAYTSEAVTVGTETQDTRYYGPEELSDAAFLPEYTPLEMTVMYDTVKMEPMTLTADPDTGIYHVGVRPQGGGTLGSIVLDKEDGATYTAKRMDTGSSISDTGATNAEFSIPTDFEGTLMLSITGSVANDGVTDTTTRYVLVYRDEVAPIVTLDADIFYADSTGRYTITGVTEPGAKISLDSYAGDAVADQYGKFSITGTLPDSSSAELVVVMATDTAGNEGQDDALTTTLPAVSQTPDDPDDPDDPSEPTGSSGGSDSDPSYSPVMDVSDGGTVSVNPRTPEEGDEVTITAEPDSGYEVGEVIVTDRNGKEIHVTAERNGTYTFEQPRGRVTIQVTFVPTGTAAFFTDVPESFWAYNEIAWAYENGYVNGTTASTFNPNASISRQQVWMILARLSGADPADMAAARQWAIDNGISDGTTPGNAVTRQQLVALLFRYATLMGYANDQRADLSIYPDASTVASYAVEPMQWSVANSIVAGTTDGTLDPTGTATRAQFAVILYRFWEQIG